MEHEDVINETLRNVYSREQKHGREPVFQRTPLDDLVAMEEGEQVDEYASRMEGADRLLEFFFADGPHPGLVIRRVFAWAKSVRSDLIMNMSHHEIGLMLGEGRAAGSWRVKQIINRRLIGNGAKGTQLPWQKSSTACEKYAAAARGNTHRRNGKKS